MPAGVGVVVCSRRDLPDSGQACLSEPLLRPDGERSMRAGEDEDFPEGPEGEGRAVWRRRRGLGSLVRARVADCPRRRPGADLRAAELAWEGADHNGAEWLRAPG